MTTEEALDYCRKNDFTIYFTLDKGERIFHINTPRWYAETPQVPYRKSKEQTAGRPYFCMLVEYVKERIDAEKIAQEKLLKALKREPTYDEILHVDSVLENLSKKKERQGV